MVTYPKCAHQHIIKAGKVGGTQRWLCRGCGYQFTSTTLRGKPPWQKSLAVFLYYHGVSMNALKFSRNVPLPDVRTQLRSP
jgi:transposase-like protein